MFDYVLKSAHEPEKMLVLDTFFKYRANEITKLEWEDFIDKRDKRLGLDLDSSQLNYLLMDSLVGMYDQAKFILTIRDCYSWLNSYINHQINYPVVNQRWTRIREIRFQPEKFVFSKFEKILEAKGLYTLEGYLSYWARHNQSVLDTVPTERLFVLRTNEISKKTKELAAFLGVNERSIEANRNTHHRIAIKRHNILSQVDQSYLEETVEKYCGNLMGSYFIHIKSAKDVDI